MNRGRTSVAFPEKAYLFGTTTKELVREEPPLEKAFLSEQSKKKSSGRKLPSPEKALILRNRERGPLKAFHWIRICKSCCPHGSPKSSGRCRSSSSSSALFRIIGSTQLATTPGTHPSMIFFLENFFIFFKSKILTKPPKFQTSKENSMWNVVFFFPL